MNATVGLLVLIIALVEYYIILFLCVCIFYLHIDSIVLYFRYFVFFIHFYKYVIYCNRMYI